MFFAPQGRQVAPMGGEIWHGGGDRMPPPPYQISPPSAQRQRCRTQNLNFYSDLTKMWNINAPQGRIASAIFTKFAEDVPPFQDALGVKIWLDLLEGLWSCFKLRRSGFPQIFSAP